MNNHPLREHMTVRAALVLTLLLLQPWAFAGGCAVARQLSTVFVGEKPVDVRSEWKGLIGDYHAGGDTVCVMEDRGVLHVLGKSSQLYRSSSPGR